MSEFRNGETNIIMNAKATTGIGTNFECKDWKNIIIAVHTTGGANFTMKPMVSIQTDDYGSDVAPDFSSASTIANSWGFVQVIPLDNGTAITGSTGITSAGTDVNAYYKVNVDNAKWFNLNITAIAAGAINVKVFGADNS